MCKETVKESYDVRSAPSGPTAGAGAMIVVSNDKRPGGARGPAGSRLGNRLMGQAKNRGTLEERAAQALAKIEAMKPANILCNHCKAEITDVHVMDTHGLRGIDGAYAGMCSCGHTTWAIAGDPQAAAGLAESIDATMGQEALIGSMPRPIK